MTMTLGVIGLVRVPRMLPHHVSSVIRPSVRYDSRSYVDKTISSPGTQSRASARAQTKRVIVAHEPFTAHSGSRQPSAALGAITQRTAPTPLTAVDDDDAAIPNSALLSRTEAAELSSPYSLLNPDPPPLGYAARFALTPEERVLTRTVRKNVYSHRWQYGAIAIGSLFVYYFANVASTHFTDVKLDAARRRKDRLIRQRDALIATLARRTVA